MSGDSNSNSVAEWLNSPGNEHPPAGSEGSDLGDDARSFSSSNSPGGGDLNDIEIVNIQDYMSLNIMRYDFSQVIFLHVNEFYDPGSNVTCHYKVTQELHPHAKDKICLFKLGWVKPSECLTYMWAPHAPDNYLPGAVFDMQTTFSGRLVPGQEQEEYFQFCYINHQDQIRGASTPFQFKYAGLTRQVSSPTGQNPPAPPVLEAQFSSPTTTNDSYSIVTTRSSMPPPAAEDSPSRESRVRSDESERRALIEAQLKLEQLQERLEFYQHVEENNEALRDLVKELEEKVSELKDTIAAEKDVAIAVIQSKLDASVKELEEKERDYQQNNERASDLQKETSELRFQKESLATDKAELEAKVAKLTEQLEAKEEEVQKLIETQQQTQQELQFARDQLSENDAQLGDYSTRVSEIMSEHEAQLEELQSTRDALSRTEAELADMNQRLESQREQMAAMKTAHDDMVEKQKQSASGPGAMTEIVAGPMYALKTALDHTQKKFTDLSHEAAQLKEEKVQLTQKLEACQEENRQLSLQSSELVMRLDMCKQTYKLRVLEAKRLRKELKECMKDDKPRFTRVIAEVDQYCNRAWEEITASFDTSSSSDVMPSADSVLRSSAAVSRREKKISESSCQTADSGSACGRGEAEAPLPERANRSAAAPDWTTAHDQLQRELNSHIATQQWKKYDFCMYTGVDGKERMGCVADVDRVNLLATVRLLPLTERASAHRIQCPVTSIRPYSGEKVEPALAMALFTKSFDLNPYTPPRQGSSSSAAGGGASGSIGGVGWGSSLGSSLGKHVTQPIKTLLKEQAGGNRRVAHPSEDPVLVSGEDCTNAEVPMAGGEEEASCVLCAKKFPADVSPEEFNMHMEEHYGPSCPMCPFRPPPPPTAHREQLMQQHVDGHFRTAPRDPREASPF